MQTQHSSNEQLTLEQAAALVQVQPQTLLLWLKRGLPHSNEGNTIIISRTDLDVFMQREDQGAVRDASNEV